MNLKIIAFSALAFGLGACSEEVRTASLQGTQFADGYGDVFTNPDLKLTDLLAANAALQRGYTSAAAKADATNNYANGALLLVAINIALGDIGSTASSTITREIVLALGLNEAVKYADPSQVARAFRKASNEAVCLNLEAVRFADKEKSTINGIDSLATRIKMQSAMQVSNNNLQARMVRGRIGLLDLVSSLGKGEEALQKEDAIINETKLKQALADAKGDKLSTALLGCLA